MFCFIVATVKIKKIHIKEHERSRQLSKRLIAFHIAPGMEEMPERILPGGGTMESVIPPVIKFAVFEEGRGVGKSISDRSLVGLLDLIDPEGGMCLIDGSIMAAYTSSIVDLRIDILSAFVDQLVTGNKETCLCNGIIAGQMVIFQEVEAAVFIASVIISIAMQSISCRIDTSVILTVNGSRSIGTSGDLRIDVKDLVNKSILTFFHPCENIFHPFVPAA